MLVELFVTVFTIFLIIRLVKRRNYMKPLKEKYGTPKGLPILGHSLNFLNPEYLLLAADKCHSDFGKTILLQLGFDYYLDTIDPEFCEFICSNSKFNTKGVDYIFFDNWFGTGLLTSTGNKWKNHRKILTPSFHYTILEEFVEVFNNASTIFVQKLHALDNKSYLDIYDYVNLLTLDIIHDTAMGTAIHAQTNPNTEYVHSIREMCDVLYHRIFSPIGRINILYNLSPLRRRERAALCVIHKHSNNVIRNRREVLQAKMNNTDNENDDDVGVKKKYTFLDVLLKSTVNGQPLTDEEIREEVDTFMFEGHDTTAAAISFIIYSIANHQDIQEKIYSELTEIFGGDKDRSASYRELQEMKYLEMVIKEGLRLYPSVPSYARQLVEDVEYEGVILPKGLQLSMTPYIMHRSSDLYPDPLKFDPERFSIENQSKRHPYAFLPFSAGGRNCIGQKFAMLEMKSSISKLIRNFKVLPTIPTHEIKIMSKVTICSNNGIKIRIETR